MIASEAVRFSKAWFWVERTGAVGGKCDNCKANDEQSAQFKFEFDFPNTSALLLGGNCQNTHVLRCSGIFASRSIANIIVIVRSMHTRWVVSSANLKHIHVGLFPGLAHSYAFRICREPSNNPWTAITEEHCCHSFHGMDHNASLVEDMRLRAPVMKMAELRFTQAATDKTIPRTWFSL